MVIELARAPWVVVNTTSRTIKLYKSAGEVPSVLGSSVFANEVDWRDNERVCGPTRGLAVDFGFKRVTGGGDGRAFSAKTIERIGVYKWPNKSMTWRYRTEKKKTAKGNKKYV